MMKIYRLWAVYLFRERNLDTKQHIKDAGYAALASLLNLTVLPVIGFLLLLYFYSKSSPEQINRYHAVLGIKTNVIAALALFVVTGLMLFLGGFESAWTWMYVISYFVLVHSLFILFAAWTLTCAWEGKKLKRTILSK
jgi:hypothetical protein